MAKSIMTVDDSASIRQCVRMALAKAGYDVVEAEDGLDGYNKFQKSAAQMVIADVNMPNMDGIEMIRNIRALPAGKFVPAILLTTESSPLMKEKGRAAGATGWLVKPFNSEQLLAIVKKVLG